MLPAGAPPFAPILPQLSHDHFQKSLRTPHLALRRQNAGPCSAYRAARTNGIRCSRDGGDVRWYPHRRLPSPPLAGNIHYITHLPRCSRDSSLFVFSYSRPLFFPSPALFVKGIVFLDRH